MRNSIKVASIALLLSAFIMVISFGGQKTEWKGKIEVDNGIKVIKNPEEPLYGKLKFHLKEDLEIGKEDDDNHIFSRIWDIKVDDNGNIYVMDNAKQSVRKFDKDGNFLLIIRKGDNEPEVLNPKKILLDEKSDRIFILDFDGRIKIFDKNGHYLQNIRLKNRIEDIIMTNGGITWGIIGESTEESYSHVFCKFNSEGEILKDYKKFPYEISIVKDAGGTGIVSGSYLHKLFCSKINSDIFVYGYSGEYELSIIDDQGNLLLEIRRDAPLKLVSEKTLRKARRMGVKYPDHEPLFYSLFTDSEGRIYVLRKLSSRNQSEQEEFDIFSKDGFYLYKTTLPDKTYIIKDGYLYAKNAKENSAREVVKRFKIINWEKIKK
jgi:WD40 repeat protein